MIYFMTLTWCLLSGSYFLVTQPFIIIQYMFNMFTYKAFEFGFCYRHFVFNFPSNWYTAFWHIWICLLYHFCFLLPLIVTLVMTSTVSPHAWAALWWLTIKSVHSFTATFHQNHPVFRWQHNDECVMNRLQWKMTNLRHVSSLGKLIFLL